jgi:hypothetical protein
MLHVLLDLKTHNPLQHPINCLFTLRKLELNISSNFIPVSDVIILCSNLRCHGSSKDRCYLIVIWFLGFIRDIARTYAITACNSFGHVLLATFSTAEHAKGETVTRAHLGAVREDDPRQSFP